MKTKLKERLDVFSDAIIAISLLWYLNFPFQFMLE